MELFEAVIRAREWYNAVSDLNPLYLENEDHDAMVYLLGLTHIHSIAMDRANQASDYLSKSREYSKQKLLESRNEVSDETERSQHRRDQRVPGARKQNQATAGKI